MSISVCNLLKKLQVFQEWEPFLPLNEDYVFRDSSNRPLDLKIDNLPDKVLELFKIVLAKNWEKDNRYNIDIHQLIIPRSYIKKTRAKLNCIDVEPRHLQSYIILTLGVVATKLFLERCKANAQTPMLKPTREEANDDFLALSNLAPILHGDIHTGKKAVAHFILDEQVKSNRHGRRSMSEQCHSIAFIGRILSEIKGHGEVRGSYFTRKLNDEFLPNQFMPYTIKRLLFQIEQHQNIDLGSQLSILNLCGGWGDRLVGTLASKKTNRYVETDPNSGLLAPKRAIREEYDPNHQHEVVLHGKRVEETTVDELSPNGRKHDLVVYSPPYFKKEHYSEHGMISDSTGFDEWFHKFLLETIRIAYLNLSDGGYLAINLSNILIRERFYPVADLFKSFMKNSALSHYFSKLLTLDYSRCEGRTGAASHYFNKSPRIFVFRMRTTMEAIPHSFSIEHPNLEEVTLKQLHLDIKRLKEIGKVALKYQVSVDTLICRISDWDIRLTYDDLLNHIHYPAAHIPDYEVCKPAHPMTGGIRTRQVGELTIEELHSILGSCKTMLIKLRLGAVPNFIPRLYKADPKITPIEFGKLPAKDLKIYFGDSFKQPTNKMITLWDKQSCFGFFKDQRKRSERKDDGIDKRGKRQHLPTTLTPDGALAASSSNPDPFNF